MSACCLCFMSMSHRWAQSRRLDLTSHLRSIAGTIVEHEEAEKIFLANALGENGVLNAWAKPQAITRDGLQGLVGCPADQPTLARRAAPECASVNGHSRPPSVITSQTSGRSADTRRSRASRSAQHGCRRPW